MADKKQPQDDKKPKYNEKVGIKGDFLEVFKVVKKDKERKAKEDKKKP